MPTSNKSTNNGPIVVPAKFGWCRGLAGHAWMPPKALMMHGETIEIALTCMRCETKRTDCVFPKSGVIDKRQYDYADGYRYKIGRRPKPGELRHASLMAVMPTMRKVEA